MIALAFDRLHAVLHQFHDERVRGVDPELGDDARLERASQDQMRELGLSPAEFLPYSASFARFAPAYLAWIAEREAEGERRARRQACQHQEAYDITPGHQISQWAGRQG